MAFAICAGSSFVRQDSLSWVEAGSAPTPTLKMPIANGSTWPTCDSGAGGRGLVSTTWRGSTSVRYAEHARGSQAAMNASRVAVLLNEGQDVGEPDRRAHVRKAVPFLA